MDSIKVYRKRFADAVIKHRKDKGLTQNAFAKKAGMSDRKVRQIELMDYEGLTFKTIWKVSKAMGKTIGSVLEGKCLN